MGIQHGSQLSLLFQNGKYRQHPKRYVVSLDGELLRYRGMVACNTTARDAETKIAESSVAVTVRLVRQLKQFFRTDPAEVRVYMDGDVRVSNKTTDRPVFRFNAEIIRREYAEGCRRNGMKVIQLHVGEAELQMYLKRDREADLNVFVTDDSDFMSIAYGHLPRQIHAGPLRSLDNACPVPKEVARDNQGYEEQAVRDANVRYDSAIQVRIRDSCVWVRNGTATKSWSRPTVAGKQAARNNSEPQQHSSVMIFHGMDHSQNLVNLGVLQFRIFCALCGTDFTAPMFTRTAAVAIGNAPASEKRFLQNLQDPVEIAAGLLLLAVYRGATLKRNEQCGTFTCGDPLVSLRFALLRYCSYMETGVMDETAMPKPPMYAAQNEMLRQMKGDDERMKQKLKMWCAKSWINPGPAELVARLSKKLRERNEAVRETSNIDNSTNDQQPSAVSTEDENTAQPQEDVGSAVDSDSSSATRRTATIRERKRNITSLLSFARNEKKAARMVRMSIER